MVKNKRFPLICILCCFALIVYNRSNIAKLYLKINIDKYLCIYKTENSTTAKKYCSNLPIHLTSVPLADHNGIITSVKRVAIRHVSEPYNACIMKKDAEENSNYILFFRLDTGNGKNNVKNIAYVELDKNFEQTEAEYAIIDTHSTSSEDARAIQKGDETLLVYNEYDSDAKLRLMRIAGLDISNHQLNFVTALDLHKNRCEKNWMPFIYDDNLYFEYYLNPHTILTLPQLEDKNSLMQMHSTEISKLVWPKYWGELRGGSPPQKIGDEYLGFFHSYFKSRKRQSWYVMGAYTFEAQPPFRITAISPYPLLFQGIYDSPKRTRTFCIYPCGFVCTNDNGHKQVHVSCGENDTSVKIISFDQEKLLSSLKKIN